MIATFADDTDILMARNSPEETSIKIQWSLPKYTTGQKGGVLNLMNLIQAILISLIKQTNIRQ